MATTWHIGDRIQNRWEIFDILRGGMGIVYVVYDHDVREPFAAKSFQDEMFSRSPIIAERFMQEARTWVNLDVHQNLTRARFVAIIHGKPYVFLEYVSGGDLSRWVGTPRLTEDLPQVLRFAIQFCDGMTYALSKGVRAHRDIKPQNCLITDDRTLKVTDFGLAKVFDDTSPANEEMTDRKRLNFGQTRTGMMAGTCTHMAPEQFDDAKRVDVRADIYSFGVMLYQMIEGRLPFVGRTWEEFERLHKAQPFAALSNRNSMFNAVIETCLAKVPDRRFANFGEVRAWLAEIYEGVCGEAAPQPVTGAEPDITQWANKGMSLGSLGLHEEGLTCLNHAIELNPHSGEIWVNKGVILLKLDRMQEALACFDRALEINPRVEKTWLNKGVVFGDHLGRWEEAIAYYDRALELNRNYEKAWNNKGIALKALGRDEDADKCYVHALKLDPRYENAWRNRGVLLGTLGRHQEAINCFENSLALSQRDADAWYNKGIALGELGRHEGALDCYDRALEIKPHNVNAWHNRGVTLGERLGDWDEAMSSYDRALALNSGDEETWYSKGVALLTLGRVEEALAHFDRALQLSPHHVRALVNKGVALRATDRMDEALACLEQALKLDPNSGFAWFNKGAIFADALKRYREASAHFEEAQRLGLPQAAQALLMCRQNLAAEEMLKGITWVESGHLREALSCFEEAQRLGFPQAPEMIALCRQMLEQP